MPTSTRPLRIYWAGTGCKRREASLLVLPGARRPLPAAARRHSTGQRPTSPAVGYVRFNSSLSSLEWFDGSDWRSEPSIADVVTFASLLANGDIGIGASQVSRGNHTH